METLRLQITDIQADDIGYRDRTNENNDFKKVVDLMNKYNVEMDCVKKACHFSTMAKDSLGSFSESTEKERLLNLLDHLVQRTS